MRHSAQVGAFGQRTVHRSPGAQVPAAGQGLARAVVLSEIRIESLGAISTATAEFDRGLTVLTGETGTGKTMVVTGLHLLGGARADATRVRSGAARAAVEPTPPGSGPVHPEPWSKGASPQQNSQTAWQRTSTRSSIHQAPNATTT